MKTEDILKMELFEQFAPNTSTMFTRVPGGFTFGDMQGVCFIPYCDVTTDPLFIGDVALTKVNSPTQ